jgi:ribosome maturation factor RimP
MNGIEDRLKQLIEPVVEAIGYELVLLEFASGQSSGVLRIYIDSPGGIDVDDCARVSREISGVLDVEDPIRVPYDLEVSSPGLDRPLTKPVHFERFIGAQASVWLLVPQDGRRKFTGTIVGVEGASVRLLTTQSEVVLEISEMERARLVPQFDRPGKTH